MNFEMLHHADLYLVVPNSLNEDYKTKLIAVGLM
jgi:hypothetical protein